VRCWGANKNGQTEVPPGSYIDITAGDRHTCALKKDNTAVCWGAGKPTDPNGIFPHLGQSSAPDGNFIKLSAGYNHTCGVKPDSLVECWGSDGSGRSSPTMTFAPTADPEEEKQPVQPVEERRRVRAPSVHRKALPSLELSGPKSLTTGKKGEDESDNNE
jgi:alpha-tubulin suppressor-like RCC1 family protein